MRPSKRRLYADPAFRAAFRADSAPDAKNVDAGWPERTVVSRFDPDPSIEERPLDDLAAERGVDPVDLALDLALRDRPAGPVPVRVPEPRPVRGPRADHDPHTVVTLSDAGAHADQLCDACYSTHLLGHWVREQGAMSIEQAVHALTGRPAELMGITDRGRLEIGRPADVVVFDPETVGTSVPRRVQDLPGGAERLVTDAYGVDAVIVNGAVVASAPIDQFGPDDELPGALLREPARPPTG